MDDVHKKLVKLIEMFEGRPNHLAKYLLENNALRYDFLRMITEVDEARLSLPIFKNIDEINNFFDTLLLSDNIIEVEKEYNYKLIELISDENYEEASKLLDIMRKKSINIWRNS